MNQRERALEALRFSDMVELESVVGEAQNEPPQGCADGSIPEALWTALRDVTTAARAFERAHDRVMALSK